MTWTPMALKWPARATQWADSLASAQDLDSETARTAAGRMALAGQFGRAPDCIVVTPFQIGIGQGHGYQKYLSAPDLVQRLADTFLTGPSGADRSGHTALTVLFLATHYEQLAAALSTFNALLPFAQLQRCERRARQLASLEVEKWQLPTADTSPQWAPLPLERCTITKAAKRSLSAHLCASESNVPIGSPEAQLLSLAAKKKNQSAAYEEQLHQLQQQLLDAGQQTSVVVRSIEAGSVAQQRQALLAAPLPGHEWVLCAGLMMVGADEGLGFIRELVGV